MTLNCYFGCCNGDTVAINCTTTTGMLGWSSNITFSMLYSVEAAHVGDTSALVNKSNDQQTVFITRLDSMDIYKLTSSLTGVMSPGLVGVVVTCYEKNGNSSSLAIQECNIGMFCISSTLDKGHVIFWLVMADSITCMEFLCLPSYLPFCTNVVLWPFFFLLYIFVSVSPVLSFKGDLLLLYSFVTLSVIMGIGLSL